MDGPSVKGFLLRSAVDEIGQLRETGRVHPQDLERFLKPTDLPLLGDSVLPTHWYPVDAYGRCVDLLWEADGRSQENLVGRGAATARLLLEEGACARLIVATRDSGGDATGRLLLNLGARLYSFMRWDLIGHFGDDTYAVEVHHAAAFPEVLRVATGGFLECLHSLASGRPLEVTSERPTPDRMLFRVIARH